MMINFCQILLLTGQNIVQLSLSHFIFALNNNLKILIYMFSV